MFTDVIARCTPYRTNTVYKAAPLLVKVRLALQRFMDGCAQVEDYDLLATTIGETEVRYAQIARSTQNPVRESMEAAGQAMLRARDRWERLGQLGLDGVGITALKEAVVLYEEVLLASSPQQMHNARKALARILTSKA